MATKRKPSKAAARAKSDEATTRSILFHDNPPVGVRTHTPIIITDGSASIEFDESHYPPVPGDPQRRRSTGLHLVKVVAHRDHGRENPESRGGRSCVPLVAGELYEIEATCTRAGSPPRNFIVGGGPTFSPEIRFEHGIGGEYQKDPVHFPSIQLGQRFGNRQRDITRLQIFQVVGPTRTLIHDCALAGPGCEYEILDIH